MISLIRGTLFLIVSMSVATQCGYAQTNRTAVSGNAVNLPPIPIVKPPVDVFRDLLAMKTAEREQFLADRPAQNRQRILEKLQEYQAMTPADRELRLRSTSLRWYLLQFMRSPATNRAEQLAPVPETDRRLVADRLQQWDKLSAQQQQEILDHESTLQYFVGSDASPSTNSIPANFSSAQRDEVTKGLDRWNSLPPGDRDETLARVKQIFSLTEDERRRTLGVLSTVERQQMDRTLKVFSQLPPARRDQCINAFTRFTGMSSTERDEFLRNAERWQEMPSTERQAWRNLVHRIPVLPPMPGPPLPKLRPSNMSTQTVVATNTYR